MLLDIKCALTIPEQKYGLNLPFAVGLVLIKLNGTAGQHGRFLALYQMKL
jgi:hypothetical protein